MAVAPGAAGQRPPRRRGAAPLGRLCGARSGDKGGNANVGVWTRDPAAYAWLRAYLTADRLRALLPEAAGLEIRRFELPNLRALNFVIVGLLGEGVAASTRPDPQAKGLGEYLRSRPVDVPAPLLAGRPRWLAPSPGLGSRRRAGPRAKRRRDPAPAAADPDRRGRAGRRARLPRRRDGRHRRGRRDHRIGGLPALRQQVGGPGGDVRRASSTTWPGRRARSPPAPRDPLTALRGLIQTQVRFVLRDRALARVYHNEIASLPAGDRHRLRRKQRLYLEEWVHALAQLRPGDGDAVLRALVHASIGAIQSTLFFHSGLPERQLAEHHDRGRRGGPVRRARKGGWTPVDFAETDEHAALRAAVAAVTRPFGGAYFTEHAERREPTSELWRALASRASSASTSPERFGGGGAGLAELAVVCEETAAQGCPLLLLLVSSAISAEVLTRYGTAQQQADAGCRRWRPGTARWCSRSPSPTPDRTPTGWPRRRAATATTGC